MFVQTLARTLSLERMVGRQGESDRLLTRLLHFMHTVPGSQMSARECSAFSNTLYHRRKTPAATVSKSLYKFRESLVNLYIFCRMDTLLQPALGITHMKLFPSVRAMML